MDESTHHGSNTPGLVDAPSDAEGSIPRDPTSMDASSLMMSPNMLPHTMVSNCLGHLYRGGGRGRGKGSGRGRGRGKGRGRGRGRGKVRIS